MFLLQEPLEFRHASFPVLAVPVEVCVDFFKRQGFAGLLPFRVGGVKRILFDVFDTLGGVHDFRGE